MVKEIHPKILMGAKLKSIDKYGDFIFNTDDGIWKIPPSMLVGISSSDLYATGKLVRFTKNGKDKYQWLEWVEEEPEKKQEKTLHKKKSILSRLLR
jgi:hypothetical protein